MVKLEISTHSGDVDIVEVEGYDPKQMTNEINSNENLVVKIGNNVYSRIDIKKIKKLE